MLVPVVWKGSSDHTTRDAVRTEVAVVRNCTRAVGRGDVAGEQIFRIGNGGEFGGRGGDAADRAGVRGNLDDLSGIEDKQGHLERLLASDQDFRVGVGAGSGPVEVGHSGIGSAPVVALAAGMLAPRQ